MSWARNPEHIAERWLRREFPDVPVGAWHGSMRWAVLQLEVDLRRAVRELLAELPFIRSLVRRMR